MDDQFAAEREAGRQVIEQDATSIAVETGTSGLDITEEMVDRAVKAFWAQDLYEHSQQETRDAMRDALRAALSPPDDA